MSNPYIPPYQLRDKNRQVLLVKRPGGIPQSEHFSIAANAVPEPADGEFLVRNIYLSVDPAQRGWAQEAANYSNPVALGSPMRALAVGVVVSSRDSSIKEGQYVYGWFDWQDYCVCGAEKIIAMIDPEQAPLSCNAGLLGINGVTAYLALTSLGQPEPGETVLVSTAAGAVGSFAGQIAHILGCKTIGLTGSDEKVTLARERYQYDLVYNYKTAELGQVLAQAAPGGIDVFFDNTGGDILDTAIRNMAAGGRIIQCGTAATASWEPPPRGPRNEREVLTRRLSWRGFVIFDHLDKWPEVSSRLAGWWKEGKINYDEDISGEIDSAPGAIEELYQGKNLGKKLIYIG